MTLPGGLAVGGEVRRDYAFRAPTGDVELAVAEAMQAAKNMPERVSAALGAALDSLGGAPADAVLAAALSVGDRQFLMRRLAVHLGQDSRWLTAACGHCEERFDFQVRLDELPVKPAGDGYPLVRLDGDLAGMGLRVPSGADQAAIAGIADDGAALGALLRRCLVAGDPDRLTAADAATLAETMQPEMPERPEARRAKTGGDEAAPGRRHRDGTATPAPPAVEIGQLDIVTYAPAETGGARRRPDRRAHLASRMYLRTL